MTRKKKSRNPNSAPITLSKAERKKLAEMKEKRVRKPTGKKPGNRQQEGAQKKSSTNSSNKAKDPRIGSKKPIELGAPVKTQVQQNKKPSKQAEKSSPIAKIRIVETTQNVDAIGEQIDAIENNPELQAIVEKQEAGQALTEAEVDVFNELMEQYHQLQEQLLELQSDEEGEEEYPAGDLDDDALWDKLDADFDVFDPDKE